MTDRIDATRRIEFGECTSHTGEKKATHSTHDTGVEKANEKGAGQANENQEGVVLVLPDCEGVVRDARGIFLIGILDWNERAIRNGCTKTPVEHCTGLLRHSAHNGADDRTPI